MKNIVVFASGGGTTFEYLLRHLPPSIQITHLFYDRAAKCVEVAERFSIPSIQVDESLDENVEKANPDLIVLAGYLRLLPETVVKAYEGKIINLHPALLPKYAGAGYYGRRIHREVVENGDTYSGATVHFVNEKYDEGEIIVQRFVRVAGLNVDEVEEKVKSREKPLLLYVIKDLLEES